MIESLIIDRCRSKTVDGQLVDYFKDLILNGQLMPGDRLPTNREIVSEVGVSSQTVRLAIKTLEKCGLVEATPGRGTFVRNDVTHILGSGEDTSNISNNETRLIGIRNLLDLRGTAFSDEFHAETARGFFDACNKLNLISTTFPYSPEISKEDFLKLVNKANCEGLIWQVPDNKDILTIDCLLDNKIAVVVTSYSDEIDKYPVVQSDNKKALYKCVEYFCQNGCESSYLFTYFDMMELHIKDFSLPVGLKYRLEESYELITGKSQQRVTSFNGSASGEGFSEQIMRALESCDANMGLVFASAWQFYRFLDEFGNRGIEALRKHKVVVMGNRCFLVKLLPLIKDIDLCVIVTSPEKMAFSAVNKLASIINGYNSDNNEIIQAEFMNFHKLNFIESISKYSMY